ncbi:MAG: SRPBCC domain-containing protein [Lacipirellulaceae bacterium]
MAVLEEFKLDLTQSIEINAAIGDAYASLLKRLSVDSVTPRNEPMPMVLEQWPGGRWFRDLGNGQGHLWGFVQVIKPPTLIEIQGPMFMSYAVAGHIQFRLTQIADGTEIMLRHQALGDILPEHREGVVYGWQHVLESVKEASE